MSTATRARGARAPGPPRPDRAPGRPGRWRRRAVRTRPGRAARTPSPFGPRSSGHPSPLPRSPPRPRRARPCSPWPRRSPTGPRGGRSAGRCRTRRSTSPRPGGRHRYPPASPLPDPPALGAHRRAPAGGWRPRRVPRSPRPRRPGPGGRRPGRRRRVRRTSAATGPRTGWRANAARTPPSEVARGRSRPLSGPTSHRGPPSGTSRATPRRSVPTPGSTTASTTPGPRCGAVRTSMAAPAATSNAGTWWERSITATLGARPWSTAWTTPTNSSTVP